MAVNDLQIKSFDFAADVAKQLITLATAIITVMITFSKDILGTNSHYIAWLLSSWILFLLSIVFGIFTLMALTGVLAQSQKTQNIEDRKELENFNNSGIYKCNVRWFEGIQIFLFILKSATKLFSVLLASKRPLITELADKLRLKYPLLPTISPCPTMRLEAIRSIIPISCRRYPKSV